MDNEKRQILISLILNVETLSYVRNQDEKQLAIDITNNEDFNKQEFNLQAQNEAGNNPKAQKTLEDVESFLYIYSPYEIQGEFTKTDGSQFTLTIIDLLILRESFTSVILRNTDKSNPSAVKAIYS